MAEDGEDWQCGECGTLIMDGNTRQCPNCGGINFYPLADTVPGESDGTFQVTGDIQAAITRLQECRPDEETS